MERYLKRASGARGSNFVEALPEELLLAVFQLVPRVASRLLGSAVELQSRGPLERVYRRWRQLLLQLPASLSIDFCAAHDSELELSGDEVAAALEQLLPHLSCRNVTALRIAGCDEVLAPHIPVLLACALYPELRRLELHGSSLPHFSSFLPLCRRLETLDVTTEYEDEGYEADQQLLSSHLCALGCRLQLLKLRSDHPLHLLATTIGRHVQPAALELTASNPATNMWLPQLRCCSIVVHYTQQIIGLTSRLEEGSLTQLSSLVLNDQRSAAVRKASPPDLPALALLPSLRKLECNGSSVLSAWRCPHLTSLVVKDAPCIIMPGAHAMHCTGLHQLELLRSPLDGGTFPASLCSALRQLSSLRLLASGLTSLPPEFSRLSSLRQLVINGATIKPPSLETFRQLPGLTRLLLRSCELQDLPDGPYLSSLRSLDVSKNCDHLASTIPFAATAARGLRALCIDFDPEDIGNLVNPQALHEWWQDVQWRLHCFRGLKVLAMEVHPDTAADPDVRALLDEIRSTFPSCRLDLDGSLLCEPTEHSGPAEF